MSSIIQADIDNIHLFSTDRWYQLISLLLMRVQSIVLLPDTGHRIEVIGQVL